MANAIEQSHQLLVRAYMNTWKSCDYDVTDDLEVRNNLMDNRFDSFIIQ